MRLAPVILRELQAGARQPFTYWLRVVAPPFPPTRLRVAGSSGGSRAALQPPRPGQPRR